MRSNQEEGFNAIQRPEHKMAGALRQQVHTFFGCESKGFVANDVEVLQRLGNALVICRMDERFGEPSSGCSDPSRVPSAPLPLPRHALPVFRPLIL